MNKKQLEKSREFWIIECIIISIAFIIFMWLSIFVVNVNTASYKQGFQDGQANWTKIEGIETKLTDTCFQTSPCGSEFIAIQFCVKNISREDFMKDKFVQDYLIYECGDKK